MDYAAKHPDRMIHQALNSVVKDLARRAGLKGPVQAGGLREAAIVQALESGRDALDVQASSRLSEGPIRRRLVELSAATGRRRRAAVFLCDEGSARRVTDLGAIQAFAKQEIAALPPEARRIVDPKKVASGEEIPATPIPIWYDLNLWRKREELLAAHAETAKLGMHTEGNLRAQGGPDVSRKRA